MRLGVSRFYLPAAARARVTLHDALGKTVAVLFEGYAKAGTTVYPLACVSAPVSGVLFLRLDVDGKSISRKLLAL
jgi:hypothetical protein